MKSPIGNNWIARWEITKSQDDFSCEDGRVVGQDDAERSIGRLYEIDGLPFKAMNVSAPNRAALNQQLNVKSKETPRNKSLFGE
jgi:hypothetical protein